MLPVGLGGPGAGRPGWAEVMRAPGDR